MTKQFVAWFFEPAYRWLTQYMGRSGLILNAYGFAGHIGFAKETTWGSGTNVASGDFLEAMSEDLSVEIERFGYKQIIASMGEPDDATGLYRVAGTIRASAHPGQMLPILKSALHSVITTSLTGPLYTHKFITTSGGADFSADCPTQPYTIEVFRDVGSSMQYAGCVCNALALTFGEGAVMMESTWVGRRANQIAKSTATFVSSPGKPFTFDTVSLSVGGSGTALIETMTVRVNNNLEGFGALNLSNVIAKVRRNNHQMVEVSGTIDFTDLSEYQKFLDQTEQRVFVHATKAASFSLMVDIPRLVYTAFPTGIPGRERLTASFTGKGFVHPGSLNSIAITLTTVSSLK
jgi:hypothetical protein